MTTLGPGKRQAEEKAEKAEKARKRAAEAARRAEEAEAEAAAALREAEEAEEAEAEPAAAAAAADADEVDEPESKAVESKAVESKAVESKVDLEKDTADKDEDDGENDDDGDGDKAEPAGKASRRRELRMPPFGARSYTLIVVNLVLLGVLGWLLVTVRGIEDEERSRQQVAFAAKQAAQDISSYDFRTIDADLKRATDHTTGDFRKKFSTLAASVKSSARSQQLVVAGAAVSTSVESVDGEKATALVYLNQETVKGSSAQRTPDQYTLRLVMTKVGDRWMVADAQVM